MNRIPRIVHFVFGLRDQVEPFHLLQYLAIETCRQHLKPDVIFLHYRNLPYGIFWDIIRPHLTLVEVDFSKDVEDAKYDDRLVPEEYRYAHHADFIRLDALIEHGGIYADIDCIFVRPLPEEFYKEKFVIGREEDVPDELTGKVGRSLCNALMMSEPNSVIAQNWRDQMASALNGTWSNHSGFLAQKLSQQFPDEIRVEPTTSFFPAPCTPQGISAILEEGALDLSRSYAIHLWAHVWWGSARTDFTSLSASEITIDHLKESQSPLAEVVRPWLPTLDIDDGCFNK